MNTYRLVFYGRKKGAIGVLGFQVLDIEAETTEQARLKAYETHEHITDLRFEILKEGSS